MDVDVAQRLFDKQIDIISQNNIANIYVRKIMTKIYLPLMQHYNSTITFHKNPFYELLFQIVSIIYVLSIKKILI